MKPPILAVNYKAYYPASVGGRALEIARMAEEVREETGATVVVIPPATEIRRISEEVSIPVYAQHADPVEPGARTGFLPIEVLASAGAAGILINHSEHRLILSHVAWLVRKARELDLGTIVCADTPEAAGAAAVLGAHVVAIEPPELIGTGIPVSKARPEVVRKSIETVMSTGRKPLILAGAGISSGSDAAAAVRLGAHGVLVASAIMKAKDPYAKMLEMAEAMVREWENQQPVHQS